MADYREEALDAIGYAYSLMNPVGTQETAQVAMADAIMRSNLYLAEQQRIANLIAYFALASKNGIHDAPTGKLRDNIQEVLGL